MKRKAPNLTPRLSRLTGRLATALTVAVALSFAAAQSLAALLPSETLVAFGVSGLAQHEAKLQPFVDEWQRLDLSRLLDETTGEDVADEFPAQLEGLSFFDVLGDELWVGVSASSYSPLPSFVAVARVSARAADALMTSIADEADGTSVQELNEGGISFKVYTSEDEDMPIAVARDGQFIALSNNPDALRGALRRYQGAAEPNFTDSQSYAATLGAISPATVSFMLDVSGLVDVAKPFASGMGFDRSVERVANMLKTFGVYGSTAHITDAGIESFSVQALGDRSLDPALFDLITNTAPYPANVMRFVPGSALSVQAGNVDIGAWWHYLSNLVGSLEELGVGDLDTFLTEGMGIDLNQLLFSWMGSGVGGITVSAPVATQPGVAPEALLGDTVYLIAVTDEAAAQAGIAQFLTLGSSMASGLMDPMGESSTAAPTTRNSGGTEVTTFDLADGFTLETAVIDGYLVLATTPKAMDAALEAHAAGGKLSTELAPLSGNVPAGAISMSLSDDQANLKALADTVLSQFGLAVGMTGTDADFDTVEATGEALTQFVNFLADRFGGSYTYQTVDGGTIRGYGLAAVNW